VSDGEAHGTDPASPPGQSRLVLAGLALGVCALVAVGIGVRGQVAPETSDGSSVPDTDGPEDVRADPGIDTAEDDKDGSAFEGQILVSGADIPIEHEDFRPADQPVQFTVRLEAPASIALIELQGDKTNVVWPLYSYRWDGVVGNNPLSPAGTDGTYTPSEPWDATYVLIASATELSFPVREAESLEALVEETGAEVLDHFSIRWTPGEPKP
jgi:hypothetical protein